MPTSKTEIDPTLIRECMDAVLAPGFKPEDYLQSVDDHAFAILLARKVLDRVRVRIRAITPTV